MGNFSAGERQLLTLARALMPRGVVPRADAATDVWKAPRVLLCDEATASVDTVADAKIHEVLLNLDSTVVMICHRLQYISRFDAVAVLEDGQIMEHGSPVELLADSSASRL